MSKIDRDSFDYKSSAFMYKLFHRTWKPFVAVGVFLIGTLIVLLISKHTPYYEMMKAFTAYKDWYIKFMIVYGVITVLNLFLSIIALEYELTYKDRD